MHTLHLPAPLLSTARPLHLQASVQWVQSDPAVCYIKRFKDWEVARAHALSQRLTLTLILEEWPAFRTVIQQGRVIDEYANYCDDTVK